MDVGNRLVRVKDIIGDRKANIPAIVPVSRSHWWQMVKDGKAPAPLKLSEKCTVWRLAELEEWLINTQTDKKTGGFK